jgi:hypothetical protein
MSTSGTYLIKNPAGVRGVVSVGGGGGFPNLAYGRRIA